jgi:long-chain acyl-CoA synthetase
VSVPLSILLKESADLKFRLDHSESSWVIVSGNQHDKINSTKKDLKNLEKVIVSLNPYSSSIP